MRRALVVACALAVVLGVLAACGDDEPAEPHPHARAAAAPRRPRRPTADGQGLGGLQAAHRRGTTIDRRREARRRGTRPGDQGRPAVPMGQDADDTGDDLASGSISQPVQRGCRACRRRSTRLIASGKPNDKSREAAPGCQEDESPKAPTRSATSEACEYFSLLRGGQRRTKKGADRGLLLYQGTIRRRLHGELAAVRRWRAHRAGLRGARADSCRCALSAGRDQAGKGRAPTRGDQAAVVRTTRRPGARRPCARTSASRRRTARRR